MVMGLTKSERLWSKIDKRGAEECWPWLGNSTDEGYGMLRIGGVHEGAARLVWEEAHGETLGRRSALHKCDNPACCNPAHIYAGTQSQNMIDRLSRGRHRGPYGKPKLTEDDVIDIRTCIAMGAEQHDVAKAYGICQGSVSMIVHRRTWRHV